MVGRIVAHVLTEGHADDAAQVLVPLEHTEGHITSVTADTAYDGEPTCAAAINRQRGPSPDAALPPCASAALSTDDVDAQSLRDCHIRLMAERGRIGWKATGYGRCNHAETAVRRYKHLFGPKLRARSLPAQRGEVAVAVAALSTMIWTASPFPSASPGYQRRRSISGRTPVRASAPHGRERSPTAA